MEPFSGTPELYINTEINADLDKFHWHATIEDDSDEKDPREGMLSLTIGNDELKKHLKEDRLLYITIYGRTSATFKLLAYTSNIVSGHFFKNFELGQNFKIIYYKKIFSK